MRLARMLVNSLYLASGALAGVFLVVILVLVMAQIISRVFGTIVPSADEFAGYSMMASTFLALAYTFRHGGHVRVSLFVGNLKGRTRTVAEVAALAVSAIVVGNFLFFAIDLAWKSYVFNDVTYGLLPIPLWIPQAAMVLGTVVLLIALLDDLVAIARGLSPQYIRAEMAVRRAAEDEGVEVRRRAGGAKL